MDLTRMEPTDRQHIQKYSADGFTVSGVVFPGAVLVFSQESLSWPVTSFDALTLGDFEPIMAHSGQIDLCLLGCGDRMAMVPADIREAVRRLGIGIEPMDTGAACRTFNVLLAEGRAVMAALIPPTSGPYAR
ncbi:MAG: Mth938-like domain-containing protein [Rhodospirillaceae bacterium]